MICWKCGKENNIAVVGHSSECEYCGADLHSCKACKFYSTGSHFDCKEEVSEIVTDKEKANFCDFYMKSDKGFVKPEEDKALKARNAAAALFGEAAPAGSEDKASAKAAFNSLFGD